MKTKYLLLIMLWGAVLFACTNAEPLKDAL